MTIAQTLVTINCSRLSDKLINAVKRRGIMLISDVYIAKFTMQGIEYLAILEAGMLRCVPIGELSLVLQDYDMSNEQYGSTAGRHNYIPCYC